MFSDGYPCSQREEKHMKHNSQLRSTWNTEHRSPGVRSYRSSRSDSRFTEKFWKTTMFSDGYPCSQREEKQRKHVGQPRSTWNTEHRSPGVRSYRNSWSRDRFAEKFWETTMFSDEDPCSSARRYIRSITVNYEVREHTWSQRNRSSNRTKHPYRRNRVIAPVNIREYPVWARKLYSWSYGVKEETGKSHGVTELKKRQESLLELKESGHQQI